MSWIAPITDRTLNDIRNRTAKAFLNLADWNRIDGNTLYLSGRIESELGVRASISVLPTFYKQNIPSAADVNRLSGNINRLSDALASLFIPFPYREVVFPAFGINPKLREDFGEGRQAISPDYEHVNAWEQSQDGINRLLDMVRGQWAHAGVAGCGQSHLRQNRFRRY